MVIVDAHCPLAASPCIARQVSSQETSALCSAGGRSNSRPALIGWFLLSTKCDHQIPPPMCSACWLRGARCVSAEQADCRLRCRLQKTPCLMWHGKGALWQAWGALRRSLASLASLANPPVDVKTTDLHEASVPGLARPEMELLPASNTTEHIVTSNMSRVYRHEFVLGQRAIKLGRLKTCHVGQRGGLWPLDANASVDARGAIGCGSWVMGCGLWVVDCGNVG